jgi:putative aldouronate transport system substrate-binding protein
MSDFLSAPISRRSVLGGAGGLSLAALLAACSSSGSGTSGAGGAFTGTMTFLLPGTAPVGWQGVLAAVNKQLKTDLGFQINPQFISWADYSTQSLLRFTSGASFDTALQARWLAMNQLVSDKAVIGLKSLYTSGRFGDLTKTIDQQVIDANTWRGELYGIPQVNGAARIHHHIIRQDLAEQVGADEITSYDQLEKFWYDVKQKNPGMIPFGLSSNNTRNSVFGPITPVLNPYAWEHRQLSAVNFTGESLWFSLSPDGPTTGSSDPVPFWEAEGALDGLNRARKYYLDGIINKDMLNADSKAVSGLFAAGKYATAFAITDGGSSNAIIALSKAVPQAKLANVMPLRGGLESKPYQTFQSDNFVVLNARGQSHEAAMQLQNWLSVKKNHDLISYGIEGTDWKPDGDDGIERVSTYDFPGFALCWRVPLERKPVTMTESEEKIFEWSKDPKNFELDPYASFVPDVTPVKNENTQLAAAVTRYCKPLFAGAVDVNQGLDDLKKACDRAGLAAVQAELAKQADAYLKAHKS